MYDLLKGVRVLDLTAVVLGPFATQYLGNFGADVIKVEPPTGDIFRYVRPSRSEDMGAGFLNMNRNKRSACLDLKDEDDKTQFFALLTDADVLVHNMRPAAAERLGLGVAEIRSAYPRLIYCTAPGFGSRGSKANEPAYDDIIQGASGIADLNKDDKGVPRYVRTIISDKVSGLHLAMAVLAGVVHQSKTGSGCTIEAPMFEGLVSFVMAEQLAGETFRPSQGGLGYERLMSPYRRPYQTKDGYVGVVPYNGNHWKRILVHLAHPWASAEWVQNPAERSARVGELYEVLDAAMPDRTTSEWLEIFRKLDIPSTPINTMADLLTDSHLQEVELFRETNHPSEGALQSVRMPFWVNEIPEQPDTPAPNLSGQGAAVAWRAKE